ncbi:unnamed protein product [Albugo candida]|uniref:Bifunctional lysine-specific demethylase and histidyl-hydroxylase n=1 Tax=Albugo candida TaxID=65357 RepID=A0A024GM26_9STRA|nr:unnamed protein product [Albugo candida]|eukprot:CCI47581.1 unnamed protein product [Albugo candida]
MTRQKKRQRDADGGAQEASSSGTDRSTSLSKYAHLKADSLWSQLLGLIEPLDFFSTYFEKKPLLIRERGLKRQLFSKNLFTRDFLLEIVDKYNLSHGTDFILCKYIEFKRIDYEVPTRKSDAKKCSAMMEACFRDSYSCQFYQPQRYSDDLHRLCASFENTFGCLTGSSVYLTPPKAQALAPHYDDVDVFILQTEGRKNWKLYHPTYILPGEPSHDLLPSEIGPLWMEFTLEQGDVLYMPRGVIHQAQTDKSVFSTHVTISVYQRQSWSNFMELAMPHLIRRAFANNVEFRRGLPPQYLNFLGSQFPTSTPCVKDFFSTFKDLFSKLSECLEIQDLQHAADLASLDYITHRLPPPGTTESSHGAEFSLDGMVFRFQNRSYIRIVISDRDGDDHVSILSSTANCRQHHMGVCSCDPADNESVSENASEPCESLASLDQSVSMDESSNRGTQPGCIGFPKELSVYLIKLYDAFPRFLKLEDLCDAVSDEISVRGMLLQLWSSELLELQEEKAC